MKKTFPREMKVVVMFLNWYTMQEHHPKLMHQRTPITQSITSLFDPYNNSQTLWENHQKELSNSLPKLWYEMQVDLHGCSIPLHNLKVIKLFVNMHIDKHIMILIDLGKYFAHILCWIKTWPMCKTKNLSCYKKNLRNCFLCLKKNETNTENIGLEVDLLWPHISKWCPQVHLIKNHLCLLPPMLVIMKFYQFLNELKTWRDHHDLDSSACYYVVLVVMIALP
jgi:hypothetical protein